MMIPGQWIILLVLIGAAIYGIGRMIGEHDDTQN